MSTQSWALLVILVSAAVLLTVVADRLRMRWGRPFLITWPSATLVLAGLAVIGLTGQGREIALGLNGAPTHQHILFVLAVLYWALQAWFWARTGLTQQYGWQKAGWGAQRAAITWLPRAYGIGAFVAAAVAIGFAFRHAGARPELLATAAALLAGFGLFTVFVLLRRQLMAWLIRRMRTRARSAGRAARRALIPTALRSANGLKPGWVAMGFLGASLLVFGLAFARTYRWPVETGEYLGSAVVAFLAFGTWASMLSALALAGRLMRLPVLPALLAAMVVQGWLRPTNPVRIVPGSTCSGEAAGTCSASARRSVREAAEAWAATQDPGEQRPMPIVLVATAGGGIRAAYWTGVVLGHLADSEPGFVDRTFAISGVSGGSVGALAFTALVHAQRQGKPVAGRYRELLGQALSRDFLAPNLAGLAFVDPARLLIPGLAPTGGRGTALESGFERAWSKAVWPGAVSPMDGAFLDLWAKERVSGWVPALLLNSTHLETGRRVIASNLRIETEPFLDAWDLHDLLKADVYATVAAHNSARFSWISPAGELWGAGDAFRGHVIDGGYFENYGAVTLRELVQGILNGSRLGGRAIRPVVIQISSDPELPARDRAISEKAPCDGRAAFMPFERAHDLRSATHLGNELLAPVGGVLSARSARGVLASKDLARFMGCIAESGADVVDPVFVHFAMPDRKPYPALGWVMTEGTRAQIAGYLGTAENEQALATLREALGPDQIAAR